MVSAISKWWFRCKQFYKERKGAQKHSKTQLQHFLDENSTQTLEDLSHEFNVDRSMVGKRLLTLGMVQKAKKLSGISIERQKNWKAFCDMQNSVTKTQKKRFFASNGNWRWKMNALRQPQTIELMGDSRRTRSINSKNEISTV